MRSIRALLVAAGIFLLLAGSAFAQSSTSGQTLEQALRDGAESGGAVYAGDCSHTRSPEDLGKTCTKLYEERGTVRAYLVGQTFSEFRRWLFLQNGPDGWVIIATAPMDTRASPIVVPWPPLRLPSN
jgi:hypothetical protein